MWTIPDQPLGLFLKWNSFPVSRNPEAFSGNGYKNNSYVLII
jgi:hypothetical protein